MNVLTKLRYEKAVQFWLDTAGGFAWFVWRSCVNCSACSDVTVCNTSFQSKYCK